MYLHSQMWNSVAGIHKCMQQWQFLAFHKVHVVYENLYILGVESKSTDTARAKKCNVCIKFKKI